MKNIIILLILTSVTLSNPLECGYKNHILKIKNNRVYFKDGTNFLYDSKNKTLNLNHVDIEDMIKLPYITNDKNPKNDAGRYRNEEFLHKIYGKDKKTIEKNLVNVIWLKNNIIRFNKKNGAANALQKVSNELKKLDKNYQKFLFPLAGTYSYRYIKHTNRLSAHAFGIAIDLNVKYGSYWRWSKIYKNQFPKNIVNIFEKNGFIWGGRWVHFDTFHFEYRPEFTCK